MERLFSIYRAGDERFIPLGEVDEALSEVEAERDRLREALSKSAGRLHDLSPHPLHLRSTFEDCKARECVEARSALNTGTEHG